MHLTVKAVAIVALMMCVSGLGIAGSVTAMQMVDAVNAKLPTKEQFNWLGWYPSKMDRLHSEYRRLFPAGRLLWRQGVLAVATLLCLLVVIWLLEGIAPALFVAGAGGLLLWFNFSPTF